MEASNLKHDFSREGSRQSKQRPGGSGKSTRPQAEISSKPSPMSAEEVRRKRDAERVDLRRMIAAKRSEKEERLRQRAKEREERSAARAQRTDEVHASGAEEGDIQTAGTPGAGGDEMCGVGKCSTQRGYLIYGGDAEVADERVEVPPVEEQERDVAAPVSLPVCAPREALDSTIQGEDSVDPLDDLQEEGPRSTIPDYVSAEALQACAPQLSPLPVMSKSTPGDDPSPKEVRFRDFLGREYTPVSSGYDNSRDLSAHAASMSRGRQSNMRYSQDDIDVDRRRASIDIHTDRELSSSCCFSLSSLFMSRDGGGAPALLSTVKRSRSSVSPAPETVTDQEQHYENNDSSAGSVHDDDASAGSVHDDDASAGSVHDDDASAGSVNDDDASVGSVHDNEDFGSMLLAMEDALCLQERPLGGADGGDEDDDVFEEASDSDGHNDDEDMEEYNETGSSWGSPSEDDQRGEEGPPQIQATRVSPSKREKATRNKSPTPLYVYAALGGKLSPTAARGPAESMRAIDDAGVVVTAPRGDDIIRLAEDLLTRNIRQLEARGCAEGESVQDQGSNGGDGDGDWGEIDGESLGSSWGSHSNEDEGGEGGGQDMTVYGVPFPLGRTIRKESGIDFSEDDSPALKMEALREYLEDSLGLERFIKAYRLLKAIGPRDDDDSLLTKMEHIVGVEGLQYMDTFIQLISIEERFETT